VHIGEKTGENSRKTQVLKLKTTIPRQSTTIKAATIQAQKVIYLKSSIAPYQKNTNDLLKSFRTKKF
jgi:hypothetical protein